MPYWWETYDTTPANNDSVPPDGAPEGHFPDQVNNIQRQAMAAAAELGTLILGPAVSVGPPPLAVADSIADGFLQLIYDSLIPVGSIQAWNSAAGANAFPVPSGVSATWQICDGTNGTPNYVDKVIGGVDGSTAFTGTADGSNGVTGSVDAGGQVTPTGVVGDTALTEAQLAPHVHPMPHTHGYGLERADRAPTGVATVENASDPLIGDNLGVTGEPSTPDTSSAGDGDTHSHSLTMNALDAHAHNVTGLAIDPAKTGLELYQRLT